MYEERAGPSLPSSAESSPAPRVEMVGVGPAVAISAAPPRATSQLAVRVVSAIAIVVLAIGMGFVAVRFAPRLAELATFGYAGVFALMLVSGGSIFFPVPGIAGVFAAGMIWNPFLVGLSAGLGNATGEFTGYLAGRSGRTLINADENPFFRRCDRLLRRFGFPALVVFAAIPNPVFDIVGIVAGCLGYSPIRFWLACAIGNSIKYTAMALIGGLASTLF